MGKGNCENWSINIWFYSSDMSLSMYKRKMSKIVLNCLEKENITFTIKIDKNEPVDFLKDKIKEKLQLEYLTIKFKLWRVNIPYNKEIHALDIQSIADKMKMIPIQKIKGYKEEFPFNTNNIYVFVKQSPLN